VRSFEGRFLRGKNIVRENFRKSDLIIASKKKRSFSSSSSSSALLSERKRRQRRQRRERKVRIIIDLENEREN